METLPYSRLACELFDWEVGAVTGPVAPMPPVSLMRRVGARGESAGDIRADYIRAGEAEHRAVLERLPADWAWAGSRILDFGCGAGSALRWFEPEIERGAELWGCDIHRPSVTWVNASIHGVSAVENGEEPPIELPDSHFDCVYAMSVFTHISAHWAEWLIELHRLLRPGGTLIATVLGEAMYRELLERPYHDDSVGMTVVGPGVSWDAGGPTVFHSRWWIERHWSPAFEIVGYDREGIERGGSLPGHDVVVGRRRPDTPDHEAMLRPDPADPREATAALANVELLVSEVETLRADVAASERRADEIWAAREWFAGQASALSEENNRLRVDLEALG